MGFTFSLNFYDKKCIKSFNVPNIGLLFLNLVYDFMEKDSSPLLNYLIGSIVNVSKYFCYCIDSLDSLSRSMDDKVVE